MLSKRFLVLFLMAFSVVFGVHAQDDAPQTLLQLQAETTALETGQPYTVNIVVNDVVELWGAEVRIAYDPQRVYIIGTRSGSPVDVGEFLGDDTFTARNVVDATAGQVAYAVSRLGRDVDPVSGSGVIGSFDVYPLQAGETELRFSSASLVRLDFDLDENGQRTNVTSEQLPFTPVLLPLTITGETVEPPSEATATPMPTATLDPNFALEDTTEEPEPTPLVNATPVPPQPDDAAAQPADLPLLPIAVGLIAFSVLGLILLVIVYRRRG